MKQIFKRTLVIAAFAMYSQAGFAQNSDEHYFNQDAQNVGIEYLSGGGYILSGNTFPNVINGWSNLDVNGYPNGRIQLKKIDNSLNSQWFKTYVTLTEQTAVLTHQCTHLAVSFTCGYAKQTANGGYIICGNVSSDGESGGGCNEPTYHNIFLLRTDASGNVIWYKRYSTTGMLWSVTETSNGNFIACGYQGNSAMICNSLIICTDANGNLTWSKNTLTQSYWDPATIVSSDYKQIIPFGSGRYALVGIANTFDEEWGGTLITIVDDAANFYQNVIMDNEAQGLTLIGEGLADAHDGDLAITGLSGVPCTNGGQLMVAKLEPYTMTVKFLKYYNNPYSISYGYSVTVPQSNKISVTGYDYFHNDALYAETDFTGNLSRYVDFKSFPSSGGMSITTNPVSGLPVFSGVYFTGIDAATFVVEDNVGHDCDSDTVLNQNTPPYITYYPATQNAGLVQINDDAVAYNLNDNQMLACGINPGPPPPTRRVPNAANAATGTSAIVLFPNPADNKLSVDLGINNFNGAELSISDIMGRVVAKENINTTASKMDIDVSNLLHGVYILSIKDSKGNISRANFQKN